MRCRPICVIDRSRSAINGSVVISVDRFGAGRTNWHGPRSTSARTAEATIKRATWPMPINPVCLKPDGFATNGSINNPVPSTDADLLMAHNIGSHSFSHSFGRSVVGSFLHSFQQS